MSAEEIRVLLILLAVLLVPGWAIAGILRLGHDWPGLQRWIAAVGLGTAFWPVLFYAARLVPGLQLGVRKLIVLLVVLALAGAWSLRHEARRLLVFSPLEWAAMGVFGLTLFTRLWAAHLHPFPAWTDSLHHTLLTQLVAAQGRLPLTLMPYEPASLDMYHLGLYALSGMIQQLARVPASLALVWTVQAFNGLCGAGIYLALDRLAGRRGALAGAVVAGLLSFQPGWYFNWGRFPQVASQALLPIAWVVTIETVRGWDTAQPAARRRSILLALGAALLNAGVFLLHFRVAGFYALLLVAWVAWEAARRETRARWKPALAGLVVAGAGSLLLVFPALLPSLQTYLRGAAQLASDTPRTFSAAYYDYSFREALFGLAGQPWIVWTAAAAFVIAAARRRALAWVMLAWMVLLWAAGNAYRLGWYTLSFSNYTGMLIMYYLPFSILIGLGVEALAGLLPAGWQRALAAPALSLLLLVGAAGGIFRVQAIDGGGELLSAADPAAMQWVNEHLPPDAVIAINTSFWMDTIPQGVDGGYWLPYFTNRRTTTGSMMFTSGPEGYVNQILDHSQLVVRLDSDPQARQALCRAGVRYAYLGAARNPAQPGLIPARVQEMGARLLYAQNGVHIFDLCAVEP